jgi:hypothetical protein
MRFHEIMEGKPLTPEQATARAKKLRRAQQKIADVKATAAIKLRAAQMRAAEI